jgi:hypothetical protein
MNLNIAQDRGAQFLLAAIRDIDVDEARLRLDRAALALQFDGTLVTPAAQSAALAAAVCAVKMFRGGVYFELSRDVDVLIGHRLPRSFARCLIEAGCRRLVAPSGAFKLHIGNEPTAGSADIFVWSDGWIAGASNKPENRSLSAGNELSGAFAGALGVSIAFRSAVLGDIIAVRRKYSYNVWDPGSPSIVADARLRRLPSKLWLLGLGNLGQATLFTIGLLPYVDTSSVHLLLNDIDTCAPENLPVQILTRPDWLGRKKARCTADWAERTGFSTSLDERSFTSKTAPVDDEPQIALVGVDNVNARQAAARAGFDLVVDAGLGATGAEAFDIRLHSFPGFRTAERAWPEIAAPSVPVAIPQNIQQLVDRGLVDRCGAMSIAGHSVGVPCTALAAATLQVAQLCRAIATGRCCDLVDLTLTNSSLAAGHVMQNDLPPMAYVEARAS